MSETQDTRLNEPQESQNDFPVPKIFISYSWTTPEHTEWVENLARRLSDNHTHVILDQWDLKEGQDTYAFMESMVNDSTVEKVLIICEKGYKEKADGRRGGVGTESQIITSEVYGDVNQEKFIAVISERGKNGEDFLPVYMKSRKYVDLSTEFEEGYEKLLRVIHGKPLKKRPPIGQMPSFLLDEEAPRHLTSNSLKSMEYKSEKNPRQLPFIWEDFKVSFMETLDFYTLDINKSEEIPQMVRDKIQQLISLRDDYIRALEIMLMNEKLESDMIVEFFEEIYAYTDFRNESTFYEIQRDHYKFLVREIVLYTITVLLKFKKFELVSDILIQDYHLSKPGYADRNQDFTHFSWKLLSLNKTQPGRISVQADMINSFKHSKYGKQALETDLLLYYVTNINERFDDSWKTWFPISYIHMIRGQNIKFLERLKSRRYFEEVKIIFNVNDKQELISKLEDFKSERGYFDSFDNIPEIRKYIKFEDICSRP